MNVTRINLILAVKVAVILTLLLPCLNVESDTKVETSLELKFVQIIDKINQTLSNKEQTFKSSKYELASFVDEILMPLWSSNKTIKGLFGGKIWNNLSIADQRALAISFNNTLQRYIQEGFDYYDGQKIEFVKLVLNRKQTKGFLTVKIIPKVLPDITID